MTALKRPAPYREAAGRRPCSDHHPACPRPPARHTSEEDLVRFLIAGIVLGYWAGRHASQYRERNLEARLWHAERERDDYLDAWERTAEELRDFHEFNRIVADA